MLRFGRNFRFCIFLVRPIIYRISNERRGGGDSTLFDVWIHSNSNTPPSIHMSALLTKSCFSLFMISYHLLYQWLNLNHLWRQLVHFLLLKGHFFCKVIFSGLVFYIVNFLLIKIFVFPVANYWQIFFCVKFRFFSKGVFLFLLLLVRNFIELLNCFQQ